MASPPYLADVGAGADDPVQEKTNGHPQSSTSSNGAIVSIISLLNPTITSTNNNILEDFLFTILL